MTDRMTQSCPVCIIVQGCKSDIVWMDSERQKNNLAT